MCNVALFLPREYTEGKGTDFKLLEWFDPFGALGPKIRENDGKRAGQARPTPEQETSEGGPEGGNGGPKTRATRMTDAKNSIGMTRQARAIRVPRSSRLLLPALKCDQMKFRARKKKKDRPRALERN